MDFGMSIHKKTFGANDTQFLRLRNDRLLPDTVCVQPFLLSQTKNIRRHQAIPQLLFGQGSVLCLHLRQRNGQCTLLRRLRLPVHPMGMGPRIIRQQGRVMFIKRPFQGATK